MRYAIVIEKAGDNYSACVPDLPGCIATGASLEEVEAEIREAIAKERRELEAIVRTPLPPVATRKQSAGSRARRAA